MPEAQNGAKLGAMARDSGYSIDPNELIQAYTLGYFPMGRARDNAQVIWVLPETRGVLKLAEARAPRRLRRLVKTEPFRIRINSDFAAVISTCADAAPGREETWINDHIIDAYMELHRWGLAHSVECYEGARLVGGLYGVAIGGVFCGESMFSRTANASKVAMVYLIALLREAGFSVLDTQFHTNHLAQFGVQEIPDAAYQVLLNAHLGDEVSLASPPLPSIETVLQSITQIS